MVKLYALSTCPWCKKVKQLLNEKEIPYECVDVDLLKGAEQEQALVEVDRLTGKRAFPVTVINGKAIQGYRADEILEAARNEK
ncbi:glutaredoxin family protein [Desulfotomaculum copahuensis]|uniref:NrdH-redoxin n=1 Tax=Desulfotomaculum copahuensis TaxID=1838280 RepID=A0A1B7LEG1_9FIRM|nr:glutaredoxin family protein [Desulfotomaculum copahuensis]OAT81663.1 NrdH-redoxin [Desulfotomaculum copahuensis]